MGRVKGHTLLGQREPRHELRDPLTALAGGRASAASPARLMSRSSRASRSAMPRKCS